MVIVVPGKIVILGGGILMMPVGPPKGSTRFTKNSRTTSPKANVTRTK